ncbi:MAG TPA: tRNA pseudouridine(55) synthase TruB, partial [bacterium]|nr:tRNA pseudouridine(55) synthase TruB [bacterium]
MKKHLRGGKAGHAGTLDPFADGVLLVCTGRETRTITGLVDAEKEYQARLRLGMETDTLDISGTICARREWRLQEVAAVQEIADRFVGEIEQVPPVFSAIKLGGQKMYDLARRGRQMDLPARRVSIHSIEIMEFNET